MQSPPPDAGGSAGAGQRPSPPRDGGAGDGGNPSSNPDASPALIDGLRDALVHRYELNGVGTAVVDSISGPDGIVLNTALDDRGFASLAGDDEYLSLPNGLLSSGDDRTLEAWLTWRGGAPWQRVFDFGVSNAGEFNQGVGISFLYLAATSNLDRLAVAYRQVGSPEVRLDGTRALPIGTLAHVAVVVDSQSGELALYLNGTLNASRALLQPLTAVEDVNAWIGRSQFAIDADLDADVTEFRIYDRALGADELAASYALGPDVSFTTTP
jgi:hypothetical protein